MIRDLIYIWYRKEESNVQSYGIEFHEFINGLKHLPNNILILEGDFWESEFAPYTYCYYCIKNDINIFVKEDVFNYGDFVWIDVDNIEELRKVKEIDLAELYYIGKKKKPITNSYFEKLKNKFIYTAHDDGWSNMIYYNV